MEEYLRTDTELFAMESKRALGRFDIIAFSVSFENDYPNIVKILTLSGIPLRSSERNSTQPLVIMGGACAFFNPEPVADFFDIVFIGEAEEMLPELLDAYRHSAERPDILQRSAAIEGLYVPQFYSVSYDNEGKISRRYSSEGTPESVKRRYLKDITKSEIETSIITPETEFSSMYLIEAMRGCPWSCRFCVAMAAAKPICPAPCTCAASAFSLGDILNEMKTITSNSAIENSIRAFPNPEYGAPRSECQRPAPAGAVGSSVVCA